MKKDGLDNKEQLIAGALMVGFGIMYSVNKQLSAHMKDCASRSAVVERIGYGILVIVAAGLILNWFNSHYYNGDTMQRTEVVEEKHSVK